MFYLFNENKINKNKNLFFIETFVLKIFLPVIKPAREANTNIAECRFI